MGQENMGTVNYKIKNKSSGLVLQARVSGSDVLNKEELQQFMAATPPGFFRASIIKKDMVEYTGQCGIPLADRLRYPLSQYEFFYVSAQLADAVLAIRRGGLYLRNLVLNPNYIFINENTRELQFVYLPLMSNQAPPDMRGLMQAITSMMTPESYLARFGEFLQGIGPCDADRVMSYIAGEEPHLVEQLGVRSGVQYSNVAKPVDVQPQAAASAEYGKTEPTYWSSMQNDGRPDLSVPPQPQYAEPAAQQYTPIEYPQYVEPPQNTEPEPVVQQYRQEEYPQYVEPQQNREPQVQSGPVPVEESYTPPVMVQEVVPPQKEAFYGTLLRVRTGERITIGSASFRLGREPDSVDYLVSDNPAVSRNHADIISRGRERTVMDLGSRNRTFINGEPLPPRVETAIQNGDRLKLGNEEFIFSL